MLKSSFAPNSVGALPLPLTIGLMYGWLMLTIRFGTECTQQTVKEPASISLDVLSVTPGEKVTVWKSG